MSRPFDGRSKATFICLGGLHTVLVLEQGGERYNKCVFNPQMQGKIERYQCSTKKVVILNNYYCFGKLEITIAYFEHYYNRERYDQSYNIDTTADIHYD